MNERFDLDKVVVIKQLPEIMEQLDIIGKMVDEKLADINDIQCTEENKTEVKNRRSEINNTLKLLESKRKEIKKAIEEPYDQFNTKYEETIKTKLQDADKILGNKISEIENAQKEERKSRMVELFNEYRTANHLEDIIEFEDVGLNITLSASEKSLKDTVITFCEKVASDIKAINTMDDSTGLLLKYKSNGFDLTKAIYQVNEEKKQREELEKKLNVVQEETKKDEIIQEQVEELIVPEIEEEDITITFTVTGKKSDIIKVREFMKENNIKYE